MESINKTFISSTFWTERSGPAAALKTLEIMEKTKSWIYITKLGKFIKNHWKTMNNPRRSMGNLAKICKNP